MNDVFDAVGQWLVSLSVFLQTVVLLAVLVPAGAVAAVVLMRSIDMVSTWYRRLRHTDNSSN